VSALLFRNRGDGPIRIVRLTSPDGTNRLTSGCVRALTGAIGELRDELKRHVRPLIITGNRQFFSVGADLNEIAALTGPEAYEFSGMGTSADERHCRYPAQVVAAIEGHCMGGGLDLALACQRRIAAPPRRLRSSRRRPRLMTGWGGTQRLPRLIGKGRAMELFVAPKNLRGASSGNWIGGCDRRRSRSGGYAPTASESLLLLRRSVKLCLRHAGRGGPRHMWAYTTGTVQKRPSQTRFSNPEGCYIETELPPVPVALRVLPEPGTRR